MPTFISTSTCALSGVFAAMMSLASYAGAETAADLSLSELDRLIAAIRSGIGDEAGQGGVVLTTDQPFVTEIVKTDTNFACFDDPVMPFESYDAFVENVASIQIATERAEGLIDQFRAGAIQPNDCEFALDIFATAEKLLGRFDTAAIPLAAVHLQSCSYQAGFEGERELAPQELAGVAIVAFNGHRVAQQTLGERRKECGK